MPRKKNRDDGRLSDSALNAKGLRVAIRRLRAPVVRQRLRSLDEISLEDDLDLVLDTMERILSVSAELRCKEAVGSTRKGRPRKLDNVAENDHVMRRQRIAKRIFDLHVGPDGTKHPLYPNAGGTDAISKVATEYSNELRIECETRALKKEGEVPDLAKKAKDMAESVAQEAWEEYKHMLCVPKKKK